MLNHQDIKAMPLNELKKWLEENNIKSFRAQQIYNWIYKNNVENFFDMTNLSQELRTKLYNISYMTNLQELGRFEAKDGTIKFLWELSDGEKIESVYLPYQDGRNSACISTQVGCAMGCTFCATGQEGLIRNLTTGEIVDQALSINHFLSSKEKSLTNIVFMGMGEPFSNFDAFSKATRIFNDPNGMNIGMRKMTVSTSGHIPGIKRLAKENKQIGLAVSLNAPTNQLRNKIMPINRKYPLEELLNTIKYYTAKTGRRVTFEYVLMNGINNRKHHAHKLANKLSNLLCHVNLIPINPVEELNLSRPSLTNVERFKNILDKRGINVTIRQERGIEIEAACGQLKRKNISGGD